MTQHESFAGLPYDKQSTTTVPADLAWPVTDDHYHYEALPPRIPHGTYMAGPAPAGGLVHPNSRLRDVQRILRRYAKAARAAARDLDEPHSFRAAALRGKAGGYSEAADLIESVLRGGRPRQKWRIRRFTTLSRRAASQQPEGNDGTEATP